jgi:hypothetical protein
MMKTTSKLILLLALVPAALFGADSNYLGGAFTDDGISTRPLGMGGAFTAVADDANASWWNPAGLPFLDKQRVMSMAYIPDMFGVDTGKMSRFLVSYGQGDTAGYGGLGASFSYFNVDIGSDGAGDKAAAWTEYVAVLSWGMQLDRYIGLVKYRPPNVSLGINLKYMGVNSDLTLSDKPITASGFGVDASLLVLIKENLKIGIMGQNLYSPITWSSGTKETVPYTIKGGIFYGITQDFLLSLETRAPQNAKGTPAIEQYSAGAEYSFRFAKTEQVEKTSVRSGISVNPNTDSYIISAGASVYMQGFSVDYAYQYYLKSELTTNTHNLGISLTF